MKKLRVEFTNSHGTIADPIGLVYALDFGVLLFGTVDNPILKNIYERLSAILSGGSHQHLIRVLNGNDSCNHEKRHEAVMRLKEEGADVVVGIYAKVNPPDSDPREDEEAWKRQARKLLNNPPTPDGFAFLVTVSVEEE